MTHLMDGHVKGSEKCLDIISTNWMLDTFSFLKFAPTTKRWGSWWHFREFWRADPQNKRSWQLVGSYPKIPPPGQQGSWLPTLKFVPESKLGLLITQQASKSRDELLGWEILTLFGKSAGEDGALAPKNHLAMIIIIGETFMESL